MFITMTPREGPDTSFFAWLASPAGGNCRMAGDLGDGRYCAVKPLLFHWTLIIGVMGDRDGFEDRFCYDTQVGAATAIIEWGSRSYAGEPQGWHRHPKTGRRRPNGNPAKEYIAW